MKRKIALIAALAVLCCSGCSNKVENTTSMSSGEIDSSSELSTIEVDEDTYDENEKAAETESDSDEEKDYINWWGLHMYCPDEYLSDGMTGITQYYVLVKIGEEVDDKKCMVFYTYAHPEVDTMTPESVKDLMYEENAVTFYGLSSSSSGEIIKENDVQSEEKVTVNGCECIRQEGIFHCDDYIEPHDYFYVAYFGVIDFPMLGRQPAMMIAFTNNIDEESVKAEVVHDIDTAAQNCELISE